MLTTLTTPERLWLIALIDADADGSFAADPTSVINRDNLKRKLTPGAHDVMREALTSIRDMPTNAGVRPNEQEIAAAAIVVADRILSGAPAGKCNATDPTANCGCPDSHCDGRGYAE
jgi:hypothetical protein